MAKKFNSSAEVFEYIQNFYNLEKTGNYNSRTYRLDRMKLLLKSAGNPHLRIPAIHIAGSKGKGSTALMCCEILQQSGIKSALYTSPHLYDYRERITQNNNFFPEEAYISAGETIAAIIEEKGDSIFEEDQPPTVFELLTLMFFIVAVQQKCSAAVIETGLGGRLDATNVCAPCATVITTIELEHTDFLGNTIEEIATEKGGIIKENTPLITQTTGAAFNTISSIAQNKSADVIQLSRELTESTTMTLSNGVEFKTELRTPAQIQKINFLTAAETILAASKTLKLNLTPEILTEASREVTLPGRCEILSVNPLLILDGSHTAKSVKEFFNSIRSSYPETKFLTIFACAADKDYKSMINIISDYSEKIFITRPGTFKPGKPEQIYRETVPTLGNRVMLCETAADALEEASIFLHQDSKYAVVVTGSFYLAGEIKDWKQILKK
jgi:dihydrofolate synthase/folylpolyglutamate synthase